MPFKESQTRVLSPPKLLLILWLSVLFCTVSVRGRYEFTIRFYEFRNPLGLQCGECEKPGGLPACCDDKERNESCINEANGPLRCDTRFRFLLRQFEASVETAPTTGYPYFTPSNGGNSDVFNEGPGGLLGLPNPFTITTAEGWTGRIQFHVDAIDRAVSNSGISETLAVINRFPINLELTLGANFTERTPYTGIYNISGVEFDMSFRVQCSENYYGPNCTTFCEPMERVYSCDTKGRVVCINDGQDIATNCTTCLPGWDLEANCSVCLQFYDIQSNCTHCLASQDINTGCATCLLQGHDPSTNCSTCLPYYDIPSNCTECLPGRDISTNCTSCRLPGYDPSTNCTTQTTTTTSLYSFIATTNTVSSIPSTANLALVGGAVGGAACLLIILLVVLSLIIVIMILQLRRQRRKFIVSGTVTGLDNPSFSRDISIKDRSETVRLGEHDFDNPLYDESKQDASQWQEDNSTYSKLQRPSLQKSFVPPKFPYTMEHSEEASYQLDLAVKSGTNNGHPAYDIAYPPPPPPSFNEMGEAYDVTHHPNHQIPGPSLSALAGGIYNYAEQAVYDDADLPPRGSSKLPRNDYADITDILGSTVTTSAAPQHDYADIPDPKSSNAPHYDYADTALSKSSPPADVPTVSHEYAETEEVVTVQCPSESDQLAYANTTPGQVTPEAMEHYDLGQ